MDYSAIDNIAETELRRQLRAGCHAALAALVARHRAAPFRFVRHAAPGLGWHEAEDIVQEAFCRLWEHRGRLHPNGPLRALLWAIAGKAAADCLRRRRVRAHLPLPAGMTSTTSSPHEQVAGRELAERLTGAIAQLTELQRAALELKSAGLSARDIGLQLRCSPQAAKRRCQSALHSLNRRLNRNPPDND